RPSPWRIVPHAGEGVFDVEGRRKSELTTVGAAFSAPRRFSISIFVFPIMPEFPDVTVYIEALTERVLNQPIQKIRIGSPFVLRSFEPPISATEGKKVLALRRLGKRIVFELEDDLFLIVHLMIAGRFHWKPKGAKIARKYGQAAFDFPHGTLLLTEA